MFTILTRQHWLNGIDGPDDIDPSRYIGQAFRVKDDNHKERTVIAESIQGNRRHKSKFQINCGDESFLISMLDFFAQVNGTRVSDEDIKQFEEEMGFNEAIVVPNRGFRPFQNKGKL